MPDLTKEQALALATIIVPALKEHASTVLASLDDEEKKAMHPDGMAALNTLASFDASDIIGTFCKAEPEVDKLISGFGWIVKYFLGAGYAFLLVFQTLLQQMASVLCAIPVPAPTPVKTNVKQGK